MSLTPARQIKAQKRFDSSVAHTHTAFYFRCVWEAVFKTDDVEHVQPK